jgi:hypothetical protein
MTEPERTAMTTLRTILRLGVLGLIGVSSAMAQVEMSDRRTTAPATIFMDVLSYAAADSGAAKMDLYLQVPYEEITARSSSAPSTFRSRSRPRTAKRSGTACRRSS